MTQVLVTGASGFIGARVCARLKADGRPVTTLQRATEPHVSATAIGADLAKPGHLDAVAASGVTFDTVVHLAGRVDISLVADSSPDAAPRPGPAVDLVRLYEDNVLATARLVEFCERTGVGHLIFASSQTVYGMPQDAEPFTEVSPSHPLEHYAASKRACEVLLEVASRRDLRVTVLRFPGVYSEDRTTGLVRRLCESAVTSGQVVSSSAFPLPLDVLHVEDLVDAFSRVVAKPADRFRLLNIATGAPCSLTLLAQEVASLIPGCEVRHEGVPQPVVRMDASRAKHELGWQAVPQRVQLQRVVEAVSH